MAAVFLMQPLGQLFASIVGLSVLMTVGRNGGLQTETNHVAAATIVDRIWRYVIGVGAIPALVAIFFRLTIPESPRYTLDVDHDGARALRDTQIYYNIQRRLSNGNAEMQEYQDVEGGVIAEPERAVSAEGVPEGGRQFGDEDSDSGDESEPSEPDEEIPDPFSWPEIRRFFWEEGNIRYLMGTSITWFLLDFAFFGLGINNPRVIAQIWSSAPLANVTMATHLPNWGNPSEPDLSIYEVLKQDGIRSIITVSIGSLLGSIILIKAINYVPRKSWLAWSFVGMAILFAIVGGSYFKAANSDLHALTITLYILCQLLFNLGEPCILAQSPPANLPRSQHTNIHPPRRNLPDPLPRHLPRHLRRLRQTREHHRTSLPSLHQGLEPELPYARLDPDRLLFCHGSWCYVYVDYDS